MLKIRTTILLALLPVLLLAGCKPFRSQLSDDAQIPADTLSVTQLRQMFLGLLPKVTMVEDFLERCRIDREFRDRHIRVIESDPVLMAAVESGLSFRGDYFNRLRQDFGQRNVRFMIDPILGMVDELYLALGALLENDEKKLPYFQIMNLAFNRVKSHPNFPAGVQTPSQLAEAAATSITAQEAYRKYNEYLIYYEDEREPRETEADFDYEKWLEKQIGYVQGLFRTNFASAARRLKEAEPNATVLIYSDSVIAAKQGNFPAVPVAQFAQAKFQWAAARYESLIYKADPNREGSYADNYLQKFHGWFSWVDRKSKQDLLERGLIESLYAAPTLSLNQDKNGPPVALEVGGNHYQTNLHDLITLQELMRFTGSRDRMVGDTVGKFYQIDASARAINLALLLTKLDETLEEVRSIAKARRQGNTQEPAKLIEELRKLRASQQHFLQPLNTTLADRLRAMEVKQADGDAITGLEMFGYQDHPNHWKLRDTFAQVRGEPTYRQLMQHDRQPVRWRLRNLWDSFLVDMRHRRRATRGAIASAFVATAITFAGAGTLATFEPVRSTAVEALQVVGQFSPEKLDFAEKNNSGLRDALSGLGGLFSGLNPFGGAGNGVSMEERRAPKNDPFSEEEQSAVQLSFRPGALSALELPEYVNRPLLEQTDDSLYTIVTVDLAEERTSVGFWTRSFTVASEAPFVADSGLIPLPSFTEYDIANFTLRDSGGNYVSPDDYLLKKNDNLNMYFVEIPGARWWHNNSYGFEADYAPTSRPAATRSFQLSTRAARNVNYLHQRAGFEDLFVGVDLMTKGSEKTHLGEIGEAFLQANVYSEKPETGKDPLFYSDYTDKYQKFLDGTCLYLQCDGSNGIYVDYVNAVIEEQGGADFSFETVKGWRRQGEATVITADTGHLHAVAYDSKGNLVEYDATPNGDQLQSAYPKAVETYRQNRERELKNAEAAAKRDQPKWHFERIGEVHLFVEKRQDLARELRTRRLTYHDKPLEPRREPEEEDVIPEEPASSQQKPPEEAVPPAEKEEPPPAEVERQPETPATAKADPLTAMDYRLLEEHDALVNAIKQAKKRLLNHPIVKAFERRKISPQALKDTLFLANATHAYIAGIWDQAEYAQALIVRYRLRKDFDPSNFDPADMTRLINAAKVQTITTIDRHPDFRSMIPVQKDAVKIPFADLFDFVATKKWPALPHHLHQYAKCGYVEDTLK